MIVEGNRPGWLEFDRLVVTGKRPRIRCAVRVQAANTAMALQMLRLRRHGVLREVCRGPDHDQPETRLDFYGRHAVSQALAQAYPGIEASLDDIDQPIRRDNLQFKI